jgi:hypothetical protein
MAKKEVTWTKEVYWKNGKRYGAVYTTATGNRAYLAYRKDNERFRSGEATISAAVKKRTACWAIDYETLLEMRAKKIRFIGVFIRDTDELFLTYTDFFFDRSRTKILNYEKRGGSMQSYLPLDYFWRRLGRTKKL